MPPNEGTELCPALPVVVDPRIKAPVGVCSARGSRYPHMYMMMGVQKGCHTVLRASLMAQVGECFGAHCGYQGHGISSPVVGACDAPLRLRWRIHDERRYTVGRCGEYLWHARPSAEDRVDRSQVAGLSCCEGVTTTLQIRCVVSWVLTAFGAMSQYIMSWTLPSLGM